VAVFESRRGSRTLRYALPDTTAVAALSALRQQTLPRLITPPRFISRTGPAAPAAWPTRLRAYLDDQLLLVGGGLLALVLILLATVPALASLGGSAPVAAPNPLRSSAGATGTATTRVEDLGAGTFVGRIPFVQQLRYFNALSGGASPAQRFVEGAREASLAAYLQEVGMQVALPYISDAATTKEAIDTWAAASAEAERQAALQGAISVASWQAPPLVPGSRIPNTTVTFYACIGNGFCDIMYTGQPPFEGAAACSADLPFGTRFVINNDPTGRVFVCLDRGALAPTWVDIWFYDAADGWAWQSYVGTSSDITIVP